MKWSDIPFDPSRRMLRQFAGIWLLVFMALSANAWFVRDHPLSGVVLASAALLVGVPGLLWPRLLRWIFVGWMLGVFPIGWLVSWVMLAALYFLVFTPVAVFFRLRGRDGLKRNPAPGQASFWEPKQSPTDMRSYFRQY